MDYIEIKDPHDCCGCRACADVCPKACIELTNDIEGFVYPKVKTDCCIKCEKCKAVCPILHDNAKNVSADNIAYAYVSNRSEIVKGSTSGGGSP